MAVSVRLPTVLRSHANGESTVEVKAGTVSEVFDELLAQFPGMKANLVDGEGNLHRFVNVYLNDEDVRYLDRLDTEVATGDEVSILPAVAGG